MWCNIQPAMLTSADDQSQYDGAVVICDWDAPALHLLKLPVKLWRYTQDPRQWLGWPAAYVKMCPAGVFANEPDLEGWPAWYGQAVAEWRQAGGLVAEPAWADEERRTADGETYDLVTAHCYSGDFRNLESARSRAGGRPVWLTEYARQGEQQRCLVDLAGVPEPAALFIFPRWQGHIGEGYDLAGVIFDSVPKESTIEEAVMPANDTYCTEIGPDGYGHARCGPAVIADVLLSKGWKSDPWGLTLEVTGKAAGLAGAAPASYTLTGGMTVEQVVSVLEGYGQKATAWTAIGDATASLAAGKAVLCLVDNWMLKPRSYPAGSGWDALHWIRLVAMPEAGVCYVHDPLVYQTGEYPGAYQGPTVCTWDSLQAAIRATPVAESGVIVD